MSDLRPAMNVFLTVDTEIWPLEPASRAGRRAATRDFSAEVDAYIRGESRAGDFGLPFQIERLKRTGLRATFFVETMFARHAGDEALRNIVSSVREGGHDAQLHIHAEWLRDFGTAESPQSPLHMWHFPEDEQARLIAEGAARLRAAGAPDPCAFRAGNFGADFRTLRALARNGLSFDSSYNSCFLDSFCRLGTQEPLLQQCVIEGVCEYPVGTFRDYPGHHRPAQLGACSAAEIRAALMAAWTAGWDSFVIVWHSAELLADVARPARRRPHPINIRRFERLCDFLASHPGRFRSALFSETPAAARATPVEPIGTPLRHTAWRFVEQLASRWI